MHKLLCWAIVPIVSLLPTLVSAAEEQPDVTPDPTETQELYGLVSLSEILGFKSDSLVLSSEVPVEQALVDRPLATRSFSELETIAQSPEANITYSSKVTLNPIGDQNYEVVLPEEYSTRAADLQFASNSPTPVWECRPSRSCSHNRGQLAAGRTDEPTMVLFRR